jgi:hypothetical protein
MNRTTMTKAQTSKTTPVISRRSGIDRRWIPSQNHQPERRRGKDRRKTRTRSFLESLDPETLKSDGSTRSEVDPDKQTTVSTPSNSAMVEKWTPQCLEIDPPDDE